MEHDLKKHVLCSQCRRFRYTLGPYQCKQGHLICSHCQPFTDVCPQCFIFVDVADPIRCHSAVDFLMDKVPVPCIYKGCMGKKARGEIRQHVLICPFRPQKANVAGLNKRADTAVIGAVSEAGRRRGHEDVAETVSVANVHDQNEAIIGVGHVDIRNDHSYAGLIPPDEENQNGEVINGAEGGGSGSDAETVLVEGTNLQNPVRISGAEGGGSDTETVLVESANSQNEDVDMDRGNAENVNEAGGPAAVNRDDNMEADPDQNRENEGAEGGMLAEGDEVDNGIEVDEVDRDARVEEDEDNNYDYGMELDEMLMADQDLQSGSTRRSSRKRTQTQRYTPEVSTAKIASAMEARSERKKKRSSSRTTPTRIRQSSRNRKPKVTEPVPVDDASPPKSRSTATGEERPECQICEIKFSKKDGLLRHNERKHQLQRPFVCIICDQRFRQEPHATNHLASFHSAPVVVCIGPANEDEDNLALYRCCMFCDSRYIQKYELRKHISDKHKDQFEVDVGN